LREVFHAREAAQVLQVDALKVDDAGTKGAVVEMLA
jgi:hypothetical protein